MKKISLFIAIVCLALSASVHAQFEKGNIMTGLASTLNKEIYNSDIINLGFSSSKSTSPTGAESEADKSYGLNLIPTAGYFIIDNLAAGLNLFLAYNKQKPSEANYSAFDFQICAVPFVRYYYPLGNIYPFAELSAGLGTKTRKVEYPNSDNKTTYGATLFGGGAGVALPLGSRVTLDVMAGYSRVCYKREAQEDVEIKDIYGSVGVKMGFMVYFAL